MAQYLQKRNVYITAQMKNIFTDRPGVTFSLLPIFINPEDLMFLCSLVLMNIGVHENIKLANSDSPY